MSALQKGNHYLMCKYLIHMNLLQRRVQQEDVSGFEMF